jgi:cadmium resistance protein CadD (predicted permease)
MSSLPSVILVSIATFALTNIDDLVLLTMFFAQRVPARNILVGQYLGFAGIVALSLAGSLAAVAIPHEWFRILGILPLAIGIKRLVQMRGNERNADSPKMDVLSVAAITLANGGDNVGVYIPFFAINHTHIWTVLLVYGVLLLLWSLAGKRMGNHTHVLRAADRYAHFIVPLVFVGLGVYILAGIE